MPAALTTPCVRIFPPVTLSAAILPVKFVVPTTLPTRLVVPFTNKLALTLALPVIVSAYERILIVVAAAVESVNTVTNACWLSSHTDAILLEVPRWPIKPISTDGEPVCVLANKIIGSSMVTVVLLTVVLLPLTVKLPVIVRLFP